jgi:CheY-like chemotaxis protein
MYKTLLIIDDDAEDQEIFMEALKEVHPDINCVTATSGEDAFRQVEVHGAMTPDVIFLDMNMPKQNGKQVLKELKQSRFFREIPVVMYSTAFAPADVSEIKKLGAVFHLLKPSRFEDLCNALKDVLSNDLGPAKM